MTLEWTRAKDCKAEHSVEVLKTDREVFIRSSKRPAEVMSMSIEEWEDFTKSVNAGNYRE